ncbi:protein kinase [Acidobacteriota bacterium]
MLECPNCHFENPENTKFCGNCATPLPIPEETLDSPTETIEAVISILRTGSVLSNRYEIIEEIGKGGMGKVYKVLDREINEKIALKLIRPEIASNKKIIERFRNEMKMARKISHKNVCRMFDIGRDVEKRYITMEFVSGEDLKKSIRRMGPLTIRKTLSIAKQLCHGLSEAHRLGIVHRDLKPHNIMIDREGNTKIMDFGIALSQDAQDITDSNVMIGTPQYLSPEQVEGRKADQRSDIYSLGVIMFEIVTGQVPFDGETTLSIAVKHKSEIPRNPREFNALIPEELSQLILKCMEKDPDKRFQSAEALCSDLTMIEQELPTAETTITRSKGDRKTLGIPLNWAKIPWIILIVVILGISGYLFFDRFIDKNPQSSVHIGETKWKSSIVVLPFRDLSSGKDHDPLDLMITDLLIVNLHSFRELKVIPTISALAYQDLKKDIKTIGNELNVETVLEGTLFRTEDRIRVTVQLSSVKNGSVIWADIIESPLDEMQDLHKDIIKSVAKTLGVDQVDERFETLTTKATTTHLANTYYSRGRHFEIKYYYTEDEKDFEHCISNYLKVVDSNPNDALTHWRLGSVYEHLYVVKNDKKILDLMFEYFQKAYDIDPDFAEANDGLGWSYFFREDNERAFQYFQKAYELDPDNAEINFRFGSFLRSIGLYEQAAQHYSNALELDPMPLQFSVWHDLRAECVGYMGRFEGAAEYIKKAIEIQPDSYLHLAYAWQLLMLKKHVEAEVQIGQAEKLAPDNTLVRHYQVLICAVQGEKERSLELIHAGDETFRYQLTSAYALLGMKDEAIRNIEKGIEIGFEEAFMYFYSYPYLKNNHLYDRLQNDPRFQKILIDEKQKYEEKLKKYGNLK